MKRKDFILLLCLCLSIIVTPQNQCESSAHAALEDNMIFADSVANGWSITSTAQLAFVNDPAAPRLLSWTVHPWAIPSDEWTQAVVTATVDDPQGDLASVTLDLRALGGQAAAALYDDGDHNDGVSGDGIFGSIITVARGTPAGETPLNLTIIDRFGNRVVSYLGTFLILTPINTAWSASLPDFIGWGTGDESWQISTGMPWNYIATFVTWNWQSWNPNFIFDYTQEAWDRGYVPVFTIEFLLGGADCGSLNERDCAFAHLQDPNLMRGYFDRLEAAAQQANGDEPVIFHLEPDASAYMQRYSIDHAGEDGIVMDNPNTIPAWSGDPNYPNTYSGVIHRMVDVIHHQAPNALIGLHARLWATGIDVAVSDRADLNVEEIARRTATFLRNAGGPDLDLMIVDWKTYDAGSGLSPWWDETNLTWPHFNRMLHWANRVAAHGGHPLILWRTPVGNMSLDNTCKHYQDKRIDYALSHVQDLRKAGIYAIIMGGGNDCRTDPSTDGGNISSKMAIYYDPPTTPTSLTATVRPDNRSVVSVKWSSNTEFDLWGYRLYFGLNPENMLSFVDARRRTSIQLTFPSGGQWMLSVVAYDDRGIESTMSAPIIVVVEEPYITYLPLVVD